MLDELELQEVDSGVMLPILAKPKASRGRLIGIHAGRLKIAVTAARERGKANAAILELLARTLRIKRSRLSLLSGETSATKTVLIGEMSSRELRELLANALDDPESLTK